MGYRTPWMREATRGSGTLRGGDPEEMGYRTPWGGRCGETGYRTPWGSGGLGVGYRAPWEMRENRRLWGKSRWGE